MLKYITAAAAAAMLMAPTMASATTLGPASSIRGALAGANLVEQAQYCRCGRICSARDYYGRCVSWTCRACYAPRPRYAPAPYAPPRYYRY